jgi:hypothetical protein
MEEVDDKKESISGNAGNGSMINTIVHVLPVDG